MNWNFKTESEMQKIDKAEEGFGCNKRSKVFHGINGNNIGSKDGKSYPPGDSVITSTVLQVQHLYSDSQE